MTISKDKFDVSVIIPSFNQGQFLEDCLMSVLDTNLCTQVIVMDGGSTDNSLDILKKWDRDLYYWQHQPDGGQAAAINAGMRLATAPFCCWINSDDFYLKGGIEKLINSISASNYAAVYGKVYDEFYPSKKRKPVWVEPFSLDRLAIRCIISQPGVMMRRKAWQSVGGLDENLHMALDYDLWWKLSRIDDGINFVSDYVAINRVHAETKTNLNRQRHYREAMKVVQYHYGRIPLKWYWAQPWSIWMKALKNRIWG